MNSRFETLKIMEEQGYDKPDFIKLDADGNWLIPVDYLQPHVSTCRCIECELHFEPTLSTIELLEKYYPKPEDSKPDEKGTQYLLKRAGTMEMNTIGIYSTKKEVFDEVTNRFGTLTDYDDNIIANFDELVESDTLWEMYEMEIEVI